MTKSKADYLEQYLTLAEYYSTTEDLRELLEDSDSEHLMIARLMLSEATLTADEEVAVRQADERFRAAFTEDLLDEYEAQIPGDRVREWWGPVE